MNAATIPIHFEREEPGSLGSVLLAVLVHALLFAMLFIGVRWQSRPPDTVSVELWVPPPPAALPMERPEVKPEPKVEPAPPPKPADIAIRDKPLPKPKPDAVKPKPEPVKPVAHAKPRDDEMQKRLRDELALEQNKLRIDKESQDIKDLLNREQAAAGKKALSAYADKIKAKIRGNVLLPPDIKANPEAIFVVIQLPTGEVLSVKLKKSSGNSAYDIAVERAVLKSSPLPKPDRGELFMRELTLTFRPLD